MEERPELSTQAIINNKEDGGEDEDFYEKIEAPKFVDFTAPDPYRPDDRYWFCLRVGCDQKHEEEIDPEAISKNFVLRVMAARSPYTRLQQMLNRKASSVNEKCPLSAPPKPSKSRVSKLAVISSFSKKMADAEGKIKPLSKLTSTPNVKGKQVAAKYLTTPWNKKCLPNPNSFRSVQNPRSTSIAVPKNNRMVAKALVFHSPKKAITIKTSRELHTPLTKICQGMKRLEITSQRKRVLGNPNKSSKEIRCNLNALLPVDPSRRQLSTCKDKNKAKELLRTPNCKEKETKSLRCIKRRSKGNSNQPSNYVPEEVVETEKTSGSFNSKDSNRETNSSSTSEEGSLEENGFSKFQENSEESGEVDQVEKAKASLEKRERPEDQQTETQPLLHEGESIDSDDKENALASDGSRDLNHNSNQSGRKILTKQEMNDITKKVVQAKDKKLKEGLAATVAGAQGVKYRKPKPTNPKPFRLRTDERRILKEANLERRMQSLVPQKETASVSMIPGGILDKKHGNQIPRNDKCHEDRNCNHDTHGSSGNELEKKFRKDSPKQSRTTGIMTPERQVRTTGIMTPQRSSSSTRQKSKPLISRLGKDVISQKSENSLRKTKSPSLQGEFISPKGVASTMKKNGSHLTAIKETSSMLPRYKEEGGKSHCLNVSAASRSLSRGKR